jgi:large subunit ribosomal protein L13
MKTYHAKPGDVKRNWVIVDLADKTLGRAASTIATVLRGKTKPEYTPSTDVGDFVVVVNADKVRLTGKKLRTKVYHRHTGYVGGIRTLTAEQLLERKPTELLRRAVKGMLPKNSLGRQMMTKLKIYASADHPHTAQQPKPLEI